MPSNFSEKAYWNDRFREDQVPFDWLVDVEELLPVIQNEVPDPDATILHIGSGSSALSFSLRKLVQQPDHVWNVDFSIEAVDLGRRLEADQYGHEHGEVKPETMRWAALDLLDYSQVVGELGRSCTFRNGFAVVVDKSTADAISCGADVPPDPALLERCLKAVSVTDAPVRPESLLALHLALVTRPGGAWICVSYSSDRFSFLQEDRETSNAAISGLLQSLWTVETTKAFEVKENVSPGSTSIVHRPVTYNWAFTVRRSNHVI